MNKNKKILHVFNSLEYSGAEIMYVDAAEIYKNNNCELYALVTGDKLGGFFECFVTSGFKIEHIPIGETFNFVELLFFYFKVFKFVRKEEIDVVHTHRHTLMLGMSVICWIMRIVNVYTFHNVFSSSSFFKKKYNRIRRIIASKFFHTKFTSISDSVYEHELSFFGNQTELIYNWYGKERFYPSNNNEKNEIRKKLNISKHTFVIISIGGCSIVKNHFDVIYAVKSLIDKGLDITYLHLGDGLTQNDEIRLTRDLGIDRHVIFLGNQRNVRQYIVASDLYTMTSKYEGISITTIEAMACQIPAVLYNVPGLRDFNKTGKNCWLIREDYHELSKMILHVLNNYPESKKVASKGMEFVNSKFDIEKNVHEMINLYFRIHG